LFDLQLTYGKRIIVQYKSTIRVPLVVFER